MAQREGTEAEKGLYRVGTAGQLSGVPPATIRAWERRYGAVEPKRSETGRRLYDDDDVARLQLMKALTEAGDSIGTIAHLDDGALRERLNRHAARPQRLSDAAASPTRIALLGPEIEEQIRANPDDFAPLEIVGSAGSLAAFAARLAAMRPDALLLSLDLLGPDPVTAVESASRAAGARIVVVLYSFAPAATLRRLADRGVRLLMAPARVSALRRAIRDQIDVRRASTVRDALEAIEAQAPIDPDAAPPARRFTDTQLARLQEVASSVDCECPSHLSSLINRLVAFERYSRQCVVDSPRDADLHEALAQGTAHARAVMEELLARVCEHDGLAI